MENPDPPGAAGGLNWESLELPRGIAGVEEARAGLPSRVVFHGSGPTLHPVGPSQSPEAIMGSGPNQHCGMYPEGVNNPGPGTSVSGASSPQSSRGAGVYTSGSSPSSYNSSEDRPRSILKNNRSILMQKSPSAEKKKTQRWDEMNILATYHPAGKDYGLMKVDEPETPYCRLQDIDEDLSPRSLPTVTPDALTERFATMDDFCPKVLQPGDNRRSEYPDNFSKTYSSDFEKRRKAHYDEGKVFKIQKALSLDEEEDDSGGSASIGSSSQGVVLDPEPRPAETGWEGGQLSRGIKHETGLVASNDVMEAKDSSASGNPDRALTPHTAEEEAGNQHKEYYIKGRYLRPCSHPELEDTDGSTSLTWMTENPKSTEDHLMDHKGSHQATKNSVTMTMITSLTGAAGSSKSPGSREGSSWCQCLVTKRMSWRSPGSSDREPGSSQSPPNWSGYRYEALALQWNQKGETRQWKM